jgi:threonine dehydratase
MQTSGLPPGASDASGLSGAQGASGASPGRESGSREPGLRAIQEARARLGDVVRRTPLHHSLWLSELLGTPVHLKLECWQRTNAFKIRGAYNAVAALSEETRGRGLVTASAGNHGLAVALAAALHGAEATVFVPEGAPRTKQERIRRFGAELRAVPGSYDDAALAAVAYAQAQHAPYIHGFSDPFVVAGQGTIGLEIVEDLPGVQEVLVPVGGGGLIAGVGTALKALSGSTRVVGVQSTATRAMHDAFAAGRVVPTEVVPTLCDGLAGEVEVASFERARRVTDALLLVDEAQVADAIRSLYRFEGVVAEGSGAVGVAAALAGGLELVGPVVIVVSGGNIDMAELARILGGG